jgi:hypothetical protein
LSAGSASFGSRELYNHLVRGQHDGSIARDSRLTNFKKKARCSRASRILKGMFFHHSITFLRAPPALNRATPAVLHLAKTPALGCTGLAYFSADPAQYQSILATHTH